MSTDTDDNLRLVYAELCRSYHAIDDFRTKLLGFLPVATGVAVILLSGNDAVEGSDGVGYLPIGLFGLVITMGLFAFEIFGVTKCHAVIEAGQEMERALHVPPGQFLTRPASAWGLVNEPFAGAIIYPAAMAAWSFFAAADAWPWLRVAIAAVIFVVGFVGTCVYGARLREYGPPEKPGRIARAIRRLGTQRSPAAAGPPSLPRKAT
jgi:hypothetical protein